MFVFKTLIKAFVLPPGSIIVMAFVGIAVMRKRRKLGVSLVASSLALLLLLSMPAISTPLMESLSRNDPIDPARVPEGAGAIVVLTTGINVSSPIFGKDASPMSSLQLARYAAFLHKKSNIPILVSGGKLRFSNLSEAKTLRRALVDEWKVPVRWLEEEAKDTGESAVNSFKILNPEGIRDILLITHVFHMQRAEVDFTKAGFRVIPAAVGYMSAREMTFHDLLPTASALASTSMVFNEWLGYAWARIKGLFLKGGSSA